MGDEDSEFKKLLSIPPNFKQIDISIIFNLIPDYMKFSIFVDECNIIDEISKDLKSFSENLKIIMNNKWDDLPQNIKKAISQRLKVYIHENCVDNLYNFDFISIFQNKKIIFTIIDKDFCI